MPAPPALHQSHPTCPSCQSRPSRSSANHPHPRASSRRCAAHSRAGSPALPCRPRPCGRGEAYPALHAPQVSQPNRRQRSGHRGWVGWRAGAARALHGVPPPLPLPVHPAAVAGAPVPRAAALKAGNIDQAAQLIAKASPEVVAAATSLAATDGLTSQFAQAASLAVTKYGGNATAIAAAMSNVSGVCRGSRKPRCDQLTSVHAWTAAGSCSAGSSFCLPPTRMPPCHTRRGLVGRSIQPPCPAASPRPPPAQ